MNGIHDMGGMTCFGPIDPEADEPVFHHEWERRVFALSVAMGGMFGPIDRRRYLLEILDPTTYLRLSYYERWFARFDGAALAAGLVSEEEIAAGRAATIPADAPEPLSVDAMRAILREGRPVTRATGRQEARFVAGDRVRARNLNPPGHTRLPRYVRGRIGTVERHHGTHVFPDANAHGEGESPQPLYNVRFTARELWGPAAAPNDAVFIDLWEDYLEPTAESEL